MKHVFLLLVVFVMLLSSTVSKAENSLPEPMVGQTTVMINPGAEDQRVFYDGMGSNEVILSTDTNATPLGYNLTNIQSCRGSLSGVFSLPSLVRCFVLDPATNSGIANLTSRSSRDGNQEVEISALIYTPGIIQGDAYSDFSASNFAFYGRNLNQNHGANSPLNGSWNTGQYTFNPEAQSSFSGEQLQYIKNRVANLASEAQVITAATLNTNTDWYLQGEKNQIWDISNRDASKYPEGKVWIVDIGDSMTLTGIHRYHGKGTIIFISDNPSTTLKLQSGVQVIPGDNDLDSLGVIVGATSNNSLVDDAATLEFGGNNTLHAATLVFGPISKVTNGNITAIGSFVANSFIGFASTSGFTRFAYDFKLEQNWPPGFRYFSMPQANNSSPN